MANSFDWVSGTFNISFHLKWLEIVYYYYDLKEIEWARQFDICNSFGISHSHMMSELFGTKQAY